MAVNPSQKGTQSCEISGIITRIYLKNFVTYDEVVVYPGKNLNLIIGPNGTGKSTLVSAIVLGLGGLPKVIGTGTTISDFVKGGEKSAIIEIDLQSDKIVTIKRCFDVQNHTSWFVNGRAATARQVTDITNGLNIQVDNLCQFLPQHKVAEFSNLKPADLLTETERSVGDPRLLEYHTRLKNFRSRQSEIEKELESKTRVQATEKQAYDDLKEAVGQINERKKISKKIQALKQKKAWMQYKSKLDEAQQARKGRDEAFEKKNRIEKRLQPLDSEINKMKTAIAGLERAFKQHQTEATARNAKLNKFSDEVEKHERSIIEMNSQCEDAIKEELDRDKRINTLKQDKNKVENDLEHLVKNAGNAETLKAELQQIVPQLTSLKQSITKAAAEQTAKRDQIEYFNRKIKSEEQHLKTIQDIESKRLEVLQKLSNDAYKGFLWFQSNKHLFSKPVHEPMILHINLKDAKYAKYFENHFSNRDLSAFVCEDKDDMNLLMRYLRDQQKLKINVVHSDPNREVNCEPKIPLEDIRKFGFENYLISLIDAPRTILNYLITMYNIQDIPIGSEQVSSNLDHLPENLKLFFTPTNGYKISRSRYTNEKSISQRAISSKSILSITVDTDKVERIQNEISKMEEQKNKLISELESSGDTIKTLNSKFEQCKNVRNKIQGNLSLINGLQSRINVLEEKIQNSNVGRRSVEEIRSQYRTEIKAILVKQLKSYKDYLKVRGDNYRVLIENEEMKLKIKLKKSELAVKENDVRDLRAEYNEADRNFKQLDNEMKPLKDEVASLFKAAKDSTNGLAYGDKEFEPIKASFAKLPATLDEIFHAIEQTQAKLYCFNERHDAKRVLDNYNTVKKRLEELELSIKRLDQELTQITSEITAVNDEWRPMLDSLVEQINRNFSRYFSRMNCAGEVSLSVPDNPMNYGEYGLRIRIKFRDSDDLQILTRHHQSGGERAVTTAVYMISLQELTRVPFRCVDEINQGMDAANERRIFELIVKITTTANSAQYFLLTPKLLPDLKYNESVTVLCVFNGKYVVPSSAFNMNEKCASIVKTITRRRRAAEQNN